MWLLRTDIFQGPASNVLSVAFCRLELDAIFAHLHLYKLTAHAPLGCRSSACA
jgi:hypothetical protein